MAEKGCPAVSQLCRRASRVGYGAEARQLRLKVVPTFSCHTQKLVVPEESASGDVIVAVCRRGGIELAGIEKNCPKHGDLCSPREWRNIARRLTCLGLDWLESSTVGIRCFC